MSFRFMLYRSASDLPPLQWEEDMAERIGTREDVRDALSGLLPSIRWAGDGEPSGNGIDARYDGPFHVSFFEFEPGIVSFVTTDNRASPTTLAAIMDRFALNRCCTEHGDMRHPHECDDDWQPRQVAG